MKTHRILLAGAAAAFVLAWAVYFPPMYLASDEAGNLALAGVLREGADVAERHLPTPVPATPGPWSSSWPRRRCPGCCSWPSWGGSPDCGKHRRDRQ